MLQVRTDRIIFLADVVYRYVHADVIYLTLNLEATNMGYTDIHYDNRIFICMIYMYTVNFFLSFCM